MISPTNTINRIPEIDNLIGEGLTLREMGEKYKKVRKKSWKEKFVLNYLIKTEQHETWKKNRKLEIQTRPIYLPSELEQVIDNGLTLKEMREIINKSREGVKKPIKTFERVRQYIIYSGNHARWKKGCKNREQAKKQLLPEQQEKNKTISNLVNLVTQKAYENASLAEQKTYEYLARLKIKTRINPQKLMLLFTTYFQANDNKEKLSLKKLGKGSGLSSNGTRKILKKVNLEPLYGRKERHITPKWKKQAIERAIDLDISYADIAYFLQISGPVVYQNMARTKKKQKPLSSIKRVGPRKKGVKSLTYRLASQVYEALDLNKKSDLGFTLRYIKNLLNTDEEIIKYITEHRKEIGAKIISTLQFLYQDKQVEAPYLSAIK